jgi:hypothetical protein
LPGSVLELVKVIGPLTDPVAHDGRAKDAFDLVLPSMRGYGFLGQAGFRRTPPCGTITGREPSDSLS